MQPACASPQRRDGTSMARLDDGWHKGKGGGERGDDEVLVGVRWSEERGTFANHLVEVKLVSQQKAEGSGGCREDLEEMKQFSVRNKL